MTSARKVRVPMGEQIRLINECRQSGMTDADWCRENDISVSTFYNWVSRCRKAAADQILPPNYSNHVESLPKQDVVPSVLFRINFQNRIQHHRCTLTIHIRLK